MKAARAIKNKVNCVDDPYGTDCRQAKLLLEK